jgi:hypothetical protein
MTQARQWWVLVCYKEEPGAGFGRQYVTATNAYEAVQMAKALYWKPLFSEGARPVSMMVASGCVSLRMC